MTIPKAVIALHAAALLAFPAMLIATSQTDAPSNQTEARADECARFVTDAQVEIEAPQECRDLWDAQTRLPPEPGAYWIWPDRAEALRWADDHPDIPLCAVPVPDGWATERC